MIQLNRKTLLFLMLTITLSSSSLTSFFWTHWYPQTQFRQISHICELMVEAAPESKQSLFTALKQYQYEKEQIKNENIFLSQYGYQAQNFSTDDQRYWRATVVLSIFVCLLFLFILFFFDKQKQKRIQELTTYLEKVNLNHTDTILQTTEDDFSQLQDEIYKTVTALYQAKETALKAKENYASNLANIAHQLKTPITAALVSLQLSNIEQAIQQLKRLHTLEEALLTLSRIDSGALRLEQAAVDIYTALNLAADNLEELLKKKHMEIHIPEHGCISIVGDMDWTMEAFLNLMKNCMEHSPDGKIIHCDYSSNPLYTEILIWDEGEGFAKEDFPYIFERFYRGKTATDSGIGIGLSLAKSIIELQNGTISAKNLSDGGACFEIHFFCH